MLRSLLVFSLTVSVLVFPPVIRAADEADDEVEQAIARGAEFLLKEQGADGTWPECPRGHGQPMGPTALATYALIESGVSPKDPRIEKALELLARDTGEHRTYILAMRISAFGAAWKKGDGRWEPALRRDASRLIRATPDGSYWYDCGEPDGYGNVSAKGKKKAKVHLTGKGFDNSNTNYGVFGVWVANRMIGEVPRQYWRHIMDHWKRTQVSDGGWGYKGASQKPGSTAGMVAAGVASMFVGFDNLRAKDFIRCGVNLGTDSDYRSIQSGLDWLDKHFDDTLGAGKKLLGHSDMYYYLYNVERVGLASGYKYFGTSDWYKMGRQWLLSQQGRDGSWSGKWPPNGVISTSFALLFLIRGRQPVLFNKLEFSGDWNNRPRDCAYLTDWMTRQAFERDVTWQIVNLRVPVEDWHDAPIVYLSGAKAPSFSDEDLDKLRTYVWQGGTILSATECDGHAFDQAIRELYKKLFPDYKLEPCAQDHDLYSIQFKLGGRPKFEIVSNGVRPLAIHTSADLPRAWQLQRTSTDRLSFQAAANVYMYASGMRFRHRGVKTWPALAGGGGTKLARLKHAGNFDPEPLAYERFSRLMAKGETPVEVVGPLAISELAASGAKLATLTGTGELALTAAQQEQLRMFVETGGVLLIDAAGGDRAFDRSARTLLRRMFGSSALQRLDAGHEVYAGIDKIRYRHRTEIRLTGANGRTGHLRGVTVAGRLAVIYSQEDLTAGLVGYPSYTCDGYAPQTALAIMENIVERCGR